MRVPLAAWLLLAACGERAAPVAGVLEGGGRGLEAAAVRRGIVTDPARVDPVGLYASETDTVCVTPAGDGYAVGAMVDYGEAQGCVARGTATGRSTLSMRMGDDCRFAATLEGDRITFPAVLPAACDRSCRGRASLSALSAPRLSGSASEARSRVATDREPLCS